MSIDNNKQTKVLIIEDDAYMQLILSEFLNEVYDIETCDNVMDALTYLHTNNNLPDLIISDLNTPQISGLELIGQLKASEFYKSIPIIIISGDDTSEKRIQCLNSGADDYIVKPFNPRELEARARVILRRKSK